MHQSDSLHLPRSYGHDTRPSCQQSVSVLYRQVPLLPSQQDYQAAIQPIARTGLIGKPAVDGKHHFIRLWRVIQCLCLVPKPQELFLTVSLADVGAELDKRIVDGTVHRVRL